MLTQILKYAATFGAAWLLYHLVALVRHRRVIKDVPKPPWHPIWGHLKLMGEAMALFPPHSHPQVVMTYFHKKYNLPEVWYLDLAPFGPTFMVLASHEACQHALATRNYGKHPFIDVFLEPMVGKDSIVALNGQAWKSVHSMVVPGFRPSAVRGLLGTVAGEILVMRDLMARMAETGEVFEMEKLVGNAVFGMIAMSLMGERVGSQEEGGSSVMRDVHEPIHYTTLADRTSNPIKKKWFVRKAFRAQEKSGAWIERTTLDHYQRIKSEDTGVSECLMDAILINRIRTEQAGEVKMTLDQDKHWMDSWKTQTRALLFGGHGTTTDTLCRVNVKQFAFLLLSLHPEAMKQLRDEHDRVCGPTTSGAVALLRDEPHRTSELEYTTAVVKETLRLFPVGFVTRINDKDSGGVMTYKSRSYPTGDFLICSASHTVHYDETVFPEPGTFFPTRWLPSSSPYPPIPRAAFRSFEVGPRACLGRDMAMDQLRALLLLTVRWFDFELAATESSRPRAEPRVEWFDLDTKIGDMAYQDMGLEAKPRGGVKMRVRRTGREF